MAFFKTEAFYTPKLLKTHSSKLFIFGDNLERQGRGGQAVIRDLPNAVGVATKASPSNTPDAFFYDSRIGEHLTAVARDLASIQVESVWYDIVMPVTDEGKCSLGLGLARLDQTSPITYRLISSFLDELAEKEGGWKTL